MSSLYPIGMAGWRYLLLLAVIQTEAIMRRPSGSRYPREGNSYGAPGAETTPAPAPPSGPYPPSGWAPSGSLLLLPGETHSSQQSGDYGPPPPPPNTYGPSITTEATTTSTEPNPDIDDGGDDAANNESGQYYVLLGNGKLQKVQYTGKLKETGQYEARVQYEEVEPIRSPLSSVNAISTFQFP